MVRYFNVIEMINPFQGNRFISPVYIHTNRPLSRLDSSNDANTLTYVIIQESYPSLIRPWYYMLLQNKIERCWCF